MKTLALLTTLFFTTFSLSAQDTFKQLEGDTVPETTLEPADTPPPPPVPVAPPPPTVPDEVEALPPPPTLEEIEDARLAIPEDSRPPKTLPKIQPLTPFTPVPSLSRLEMSNTVKRYVLVRDGITFGEPGRRLVAFSTSGENGGTLVEPASRMVDELYATDVHPLLWQNRFNTLATAESNIECIWRISGPTELVQKAVVSDEVSEASWWWVEGFADARTPLSIDIFLYPKGDGKIVCKRGKTYIGASKCLTAARSTGKQLPAGKYPIVTKCDQKDAKGIPYRMSGEAHVRMYYAMNLQTLTGKNLHGGNTAAGQSTTALGCIRMPAGIQRQIYDAAKVKETIVEIHHEEE